MVAAHSQRDWSCPPPLDRGSIVVVTDPPFSYTTTRRKAGPATKRTNTALIIGCSDHEGRIACLV
jgi:hypothetical protein